MKTVFLFLSVFCFANLYAQNNSAEFKKLFKAFTKSAQGQYEISPGGDDLPEGQRQPQDLLMFPISHWATDTDAWFCLVWLSPKFKEKPLEQVFIRFAYKDAKTMTSDFYATPANAPEGISLEWRKPKPFASLTPDFIMTESLPCKGFATAGENGLFSIESGSPCPSATKAAAYSSIQLDMRFYGKAYSSATKFYAPDGKIVIQYPHELQFKKKASNLKKY